MNTYNTPQAYHFDTQTFRQGVSDFEDDREIRQPQSVKRLYRANYFFWYGSRSAISQVRLASPQLLSWGRITSASPHFPLRLATRSPYRVHRFQARSQPWLAASSFVFPAMMTKMRKKQHPAAGYPICSQCGVTDSPVHRRGVLHRHYALIQQMIARGESGTAIAARLGVSRVRGAEIRRRLKLT